MDYQDSRKLLGRFGLPGHAHTIKIRDLSGIFSFLSVCIIFSSNLFVNIMFTRTLLVVEVINYFNL